MAVARTFYQSDPRCQTLSMYTSVASMFSLSSRDQVHSKKVIQSAIASSPYYLHVLSSTSPTSLHAFHAMQQQIMSSSWTLEPAHIFVACSKEVCIEWMEATVLLSTTWI